MHGKSRLASQGAGRFVFRSSPPVPPFRMPFLPPEALASGDDIVAAAAQAVRLARRGDARSGLVLAHQARTRARDLEIETGELEALNAAAIVHLMRRDVVSAVAASLDACHLGRQRGDRSLLGHARVTLAVAASELEACDCPLAVLRECAQQARWHGDACLQARARTAVGVVLGDRGSFEEAGLELARALLLARSCDCATTPARVTANLANLHRKRARAYVGASDREPTREACAEARETALRAAALARQDDEITTRIDALGIAGAAAALAGDTGQAREDLEASIALGRAARASGAITWVLCELGRLEIGAGRLPAARGAYLHALDLASEMRPSRNVAAACHGLADVAHAGGDEVGERHWRERARVEADEFERLRDQTRLQLRGLAA